jgi:hypothetical protein
VGRAAVCPKGDGKNRLLRAGRYLHEAHTFPQRTEKANRPVYAMETAISLTLLPSER